MTTSTAIVPTAVASRQADDEPRLAALAAPGRQARELLGTEKGSDEQRALLHEAETLIEGKARP